MNNDDLKKLREICTEGWVGGRSPKEVEAMVAGNKVSTAVDSIDSLLEEINNYLSEDVVNMNLIMIIIERLQSIKADLESDE